MLTLDAPSALQINSWLSIIGAECLAQSDDRWTCRSRKYLLQILFLLGDSFFVLCNNSVVKKEPIDYALDYIRSNYNLGLTLAEISVSCGYNYESYFIKVFIEECGISPSEYRKKIWEKD